MANSVSWADPQKRATRRLPFFTPWELTSAVQYWTNLQHWDFAEMFTLLAFDKARKSQVPASMLRNTKAELDVLHVVPMCVNPLGQAFVTV